MSSNTQPAQTPSSSSSLSLSPQTPFLPPSSLSIPINPNTNPNLATSPSKTFLKYAAALSKSPNSQSPISTQRGFNPTQEIDHDHNHPEHHDSFEFGDYGDLKTKSWTAGVNRRAASISGPVSVPANTQQAGQGTGQGQGAQGLGIMNGFSKEGGGQSGVMADKLAKGQGVLRRLSLTGSSFSRVCQSLPKQPIQ